MKKCVGKALHRAWPAASMHTWQLLHHLPLHHCRSPSSLLSTVPFGAQLCPLVPPGWWLPGPAGLSLSVHSFVHSSVKPFLCARDPGSCQVVGSGFQQWLLAVWAGPHLLPLCNLDVTLSPAAVPPVSVHSLSADWGVLHGTPTLISAVPLPPGKTRGDIARPIHKPLFSFYSVHGPTEGPKERM